MQLATTPRIAFLRELRAEITHNYPRGRVIVAVDGMDGSGAGEIADGLAEVFRELGTDVARASMRDFHRPRAERYALGRQNAEGFYTRSFDESALRRALVDPFMMAGSTGFQTSFFDVNRDAPVVASWRTGPADLVLVLDGPFLLRPELRGAWHAGIHVDVPVETAYERLAARDGRDPDPDSERNARYTGGWKLYLEQAEPRFAATAVVDNEDLEHPRRVFPDTGCACF